MKLERDKVSSTKFTHVNNMTPIGFKLNIKDVCPKSQIHFSVN